MLIVCPTCATTYQIQLATLGAAGRSVRCTKCKNTWFATPDSVIERSDPYHRQRGSEPARSAESGRQTACAAPEQTDEELAAAWGSEAMSGET